MSINIVGKGLSFFLQDNDPAAQRRHLDLFSNDKLPPHLHDEEVLRDQVQTPRFAFIENANNSRIVVNGIDEFYYYLRELYLYTETVYEVWLSDSELFIMDQIFDHLVQEFGCRKSFFEYKIRAKSL